MSKEDYRTKVEHPSHTADVEDWKGFPTESAVENNVLYVKGDPSLTLGAKDLRCPVCGQEYSSSLGGGLCVNGYEPYTGTYCLKCWAKWISENIPRCEEINKRQQATDVDNSTKM
jgi:hypothetical protein